MKKILLIGHAGFYNRGCEAIVRGTIEIIKHYVPNSRITLCSYRPDEDTFIAREKNIKVDRIVPHRLPGAPKQSLAWAWQTFNRRILHRNMAFLDFLHRSFYKNNDIVISIGGDNFSDDYGGPDAFFSSLDAARRYGARIVIWGASIGPFKNKAKEGQWAKKLSKCDLITAREDRTVSYLSTLGVAHNVRRVADPAFCMEATVPISNLRNEFFDGKLIVGIGMSGLISRYGRRKRDYIDTFSEFVEYLIEKYKARILFVPHVTGDRNELNDTKICNEVIKSVRKGFNYWLLPSDYDACEMKYCISKCQYFIGARTHSTISSFSMGVPTISVGYSVKAWGINEDLLGTDEYVISNDDLSKNRLVDVFGRLVRNRDLVRRTLLNRVTFVQENAKKAGAYLNSLC